ncbi:hypothetical protein MKX01_008456 [Papaver californicum]|nr:hypothetical protein MKX01_008456 [Papaver californicum]
MRSETPKSNLNAPLNQKIVKEVKKQLWLAGPLISVNVLRYCLQMIYVMFVGHLGKFSLSGASMATSLASVTGFNLLNFQVLSDTLCGQSYGAKQFRMLGIHMQRAMFVLSVVSIPLAFVWANISLAAGVYARFMIPSIFSYGLLQCEVRFLQTQSIVFPMMISSAITAILHILVCWVLVFKTDLGFRGAATANAISYWINTLLLNLTGFSKEALQDIPNFMRLAIPSAIMMCLESWSFELMVLLSVVLLMTIEVGTMTGSIMILVRRPWGYAYSNDEEVVSYVATMVPIIAVSTFLDSIQCVLSDFGVSINLGAYYLVGIPSGILLAFVLIVGGKGLWFGIICALVVQVVSLLVVTWRTNWEQQAKQATSRVYESTIPAYMVS